MKSEMQKGFEAQRAQGINVDWFTWQIAWLDAASMSAEPVKLDYIDNLPTPDRIVCGDLNTPDAERDLAEICERFGWRRNKHALVDQGGVFRMRTADALRIYASQSAKEPK